MESNDDNSLEKEEFDDKEELEEEEKPVIKNV